MPRKLHYLYVGLAGVGVGAGGGGVYPYGG
jgi:hypothetical protein